MQNALEENYLAAFRIAEHERNVAHWRLSQAARREGRQTTAASGHRLRLCWRGASQRIAALLAGLRRDSIRQHLTGARS